MDFDQLVSNQKPSDRELLFYRILKKYVYSALIRLNTV